MTELSPELEEFIKMTDVILNEAHEKAVVLPPNTVQVWPGGKTFKTIQAAIDSITDASPKLIYNVAVGSGTYTEKVTMKDYVLVAGAGSAVTTITSLATTPASGVVTSAAGCGINALTILATDSASAKRPVAISMQGTGNFTIKGVTINCGDETTLENNCFGISNGSFYAGTVILSNSNLTVYGGDRGICVGINLTGATGVSNPVCFVQSSNIQVSSNNMNIAVKMDSGAVATLTGSKIAASSFALLNTDGGSYIEANKCKIAGPVSPGVVVNP